MAGRQNGKNDYYNKLEPDAELKARLLNTCIENIDVINYFKNGYSLEDIFLQKDKLLELHSLCPL